MCTSIYQVTLDHTHLLARTMDWPILAVSPLFVPRQFKWANAFDHRIYTNKYAMVGGGSISATRIDVSDGVNEHGLMAQTTEMSVTRRKFSLQRMNLSFGFSATFEPSLKSKSTLMKLN